MQSIIAMGDRDKTTIEVDAEIWRLLQSRKSIGDSFNDVLRRDYGLDDEGDGDTHDHDHDMTAVDDVLAEWEPAEGDIERGRELVRQAVRILQGNGWLRRGEIMPEVTTGLAARTAWEKNIAPGLRALRDDAGLVEVERDDFETAHWRWVGEE